MRSRPKLKAAYQERVGIPPNAPFWREAEGLVSEGADLVYDVGSVQLYAPSAARDPRQ